MYKLTAIELNKYIVSRRNDHRYICEFHHIEQFLAAIMTADADVRLIEPEWLREKLVLGAKRVLENNAEPAKATAKKAK